MEEKPLAVQMHRAVLQAQHLAKKLPPPCPALSHAEFMTLDLIQDYRQEHPEVPGLKVSLLSHWLQLSRPAVSHLINGMEDRDLLERVSSRADRRVTYLVPTQRAKDLLAQQEAEFLRLMALFSDRLGEEDTRTFIRLCQKISGILQELQTHPQTLSRKEASAHG